MVPSCLYLRVLLGEVRSKQSMPEIERPKKESVNAEKMDKNVKTRLIPLPGEFHESEGVFTLSPDSVIGFSGDQACSVAELFAGQLRAATGFVLPVQMTGGDIHLCIDEHERCGPEGYRMQIEQTAVVIRANRPAGLFYGTQTLRQLFPPEIFSSVPVDRRWSAGCVTIRDTPRFGWRGMHLDVSRHFMPEQDVIRFIDTIASLKMNVFHWHLTDDQGWRVEIRKYPDLTDVGGWREGTLIGHMREYDVRPDQARYDNRRYGGFYTQTQIRRIVEYAARRHVTVVPEIDMPGHMQAAIAAYPHLGCSRNQVPVRREWGISEDILNPEESTVQFCCDVLAEIMELFPGSFIHIGGDEALKTQWEASPRIQQLRKKRGLKDMQAMQSWFIHQIERFLTPAGRRLIGWEEILEGGAPSSAVILPWTCEDKGVQAARAGHDVIMAPSPFVYFDHYQSQNSNEPLAIGGCTPLEKVYSFNPVPAELTPAEQRRILGAQGQLWTEYMPDMRQVEYMAFPRTCALAEVLWSAEKGEYADFLHRLCSQSQRLDFLGVNYRAANTCEKCA